MISFGFLDSNGIIHSDWKFAFLFIENSEFPHYYWVKEARESYKGEKCVCGTRKQPRCVHMFTHQFASVMRATDYASKSLLQAH